ncbi:hypothetical protein Scep_000169 [Stephania cephalantha]|uniref:Chitin-binding type-1 domain-containing protein n=1 Tax=Stephania cephalantha TaxID=152367 RepID=A0AAP0Q2Q2_9MAGN
MNRSNYKPNSAILGVCLVLSLVSLIGRASAQAQCGSQAGGKVCPGGLCCSRFGFCGSTDPWCGDGCQSNCNPRPGPSPTPPTTPSPTPPTTPSTGGDISSLISQATFNEMLKHRGDSNCRGSFYTYDSFLAAARSFNGFGTTGDTDTRKREIAAFFGQTSHETTGGWPTAPDGPYAWGYCFIEERGNPGDYCRASAEWPCAPGKKYYGRGPIQISWYGCKNYNYGQAGRAIGVDLLNNPDLVTSDPVISFKTALWFWMTTQSPKPSCHDVITGRWTPSDADRQAGRVPGYGVITNIINGGIECGKGPNPQVQDRIGYYQRYCGLLGVSTGDNLDCFGQRSFAP